jgi:hypothetical protein
MEEKLDKKENTPVRRSVSFASDAGLGLRPGRCGYADSAACH